MPSLEVLVRDPGSLANSSSVVAALAQSEQGPIVAVCSPPTLR